MVRTTLGMAVMALLAATAGCKMCAHPYDDCGPVWTAPPGADCQNCNPNYRAGSAFTGRGAMVKSPIREIQPEDFGPAVSPAPAALPARSDNGDRRPASVDYGSFNPQSSGASSRFRKAAEAAAATPHRAPSRPFSYASDRLTAEKQPVENPGVPHLAPPRDDAEPPMKLPPGTVLAPPGTREGDTRILSVTDRRLDESEKPAADGPQPKEPAPMRSVEPQVQSPAPETPGWRAVSRPRTGPQPVTVE